MLRQQVGSMKSLKKPLFIHIATNETGIVQKKHCRFRNRDCDDEYDAHLSDDSLLLLDSKYPINMFY